MFDRLFGVGRQLWFNLLQMVARRRKLLDYLKDTAADRYKSAIEKLNLRK